ncbi:MAG TPA: C39 family peptidase [Terracidiphilus sp.]|nr:C39 family peptidase [Terracidiphilus sp.]
MLRRLILASVLLPALCSAALAADAVNIWLDVPFVRQQKDGCGAASISMVMQYWQQHQGLPASSDAAYDRIQGKLYSPRAHGIYASAMQSYFRQNGYRVFAFSGKWTDIERELRNGRPLIAALKPVAGSKELHYVVVVGLDQPDQLVLVNDPDQRKLLKEDQSTFGRDWKATGNWILLAVPEAPAK